MLFYVFVCHPKLPKFEKCSCEKYWKYHRANYKTWKLLQYKAADRCQRKNKHEISVWHISEGKETFVFDVWHCSRWHFIGNAGFIKRFVRILAKERRIITLIVEWEIDQHRLGHHPNHSVSKELDSVFGHAHKKSIQPTYLISSSTNVQTVCHFIYFPPSNTSNGAVLARCSLNFDDFLEFKIAKTSKLCIIFQPKWWQTYRSFMSNLNQIQHFTLCCTMLLNNSTRESGCQMEIQGRETRLNWMSIFIWNVHILNRTNETKIIFGTFFA